jgi:surfactin synthase thioesterase subunit
MSQLVDQVVDALRGWLDRPFALFGHSMGSTLAFELARRLRAQGAPSPIHLFVSGRRAPHLPDHDSPLHNLSEAALLDELVARYGAASSALLRDPELRPLLLPVLRADLEAVETYTYAVQPPLDCPINAFGGMADPRANAAQLAAWREHTTAAFLMRCFPGDHFYLQPGRVQVLAQVSSALSPWI